MVQNDPADDRKEKVQAKSGPVPAPQAIDLKRVSLSVGLGQASLSHPDMLDVQLAAAAMKTIFDQFVLHARCWAGVGKSKVSLNPDDARVTDVKLFMDLEAISGSQTHLQEQFADYLTAKCPLLPTELRRFNLVFVDTYAEKAIALRVGESLAVCSDTKLQLESQSSVAIEQWQYCAGRRDLTDPSIEAALMKALDSEFLAASRQSTPL